MEPPRTFVRTDSTGRDIGGRYTGREPKDAALKARTQMKGRGKKNIYMRETGKRDVRHYDINRQPLPKSKQGQYWTHRTFGTYVGKL